MSEFFGNLVARSMGRVAEAGSGTILRPRLPSLFEAPVGADGVAAPLASTRRDPDEMEVDLPLHMPTDERETLYYRRHEASPDASSMDAADDEAIHPKGIPHSHRAGRGGYRPQPGSAIEQAYPHTLRVSTKRTEEAGLAGVLSPEKSAMGRQPGQVEAPGAGLALQPRIDHYTGAPEKPLAVSIDPLGARKNSGPDQYGQSAEEAQAPTVHISIGRIEVRAVTLPAPQPAPRPVRQRPRLGLDDYLRQRNEAKR